LTKLLGDCQHINVYSNAFSNIYLTVEFSESISSYYYYPESILSPLLLLQPLTPMSLLLLAEIPNLSLFAVHILMP